MNIVFDDLKGNKDGILIYVINRKDGGDLLGVFQANDNAELRKLFIEDDENNLLEWQEGVTYEPIAKLK